MAVVTIDGRDHYLGKYGSTESHAKYARLIAEWEARRHGPGTKSTGGIIVNELILRYLQFAATYFVKDGINTDEVYGIKAAARPLRRLYGETLVQDFGPLKLKAVREAMIDADLSRGTINQNVGRVRRMFSWGVEMEFVPPAVCQALREVRGLAKGRSRARETAPVAPVAEANVLAVLPEISEPLQAMVMFQWHTGCRPGAACILRPRDVDQSGDVWRYDPESHKTEHHDRECRIYIGPRGREILLPWLDRDPEAYCFSPKEAVEFDRKRLGDAKTQADRAKRPRPGRRRDYYTTDSYRRAIARACDRVGVEHWSPNQLRHAKATEIRRKFGLEAAQCVLGHSKADVTQVYAERDFELAMNVMREVG
ncbi:MAG: site-specific integrase [Planctomycetales bacterium]